jgi:hypothetical protein
MFELNQQPAIQSLFGGFFLTKKSATANRKKGFYPNRDSNKQEVGFILYVLYEAAQNFEVPLSCRSKLAGRYL